jgi:hypothetical protein
MVGSGAVAPEPFFQFFPAMAFSSNEKRFVKLHKKFLKFL